MKIFVLFITSSWAIAGAPKDEELLQYVRNRSSLERVTPALVDMAPVVAARCKSELVLDPNPHEKAQFYTFANAAAVLPLFDPWGEFPVGSLLVKEKFGSDGKSQLFTGMWKREDGYFPEVGDWEFFTVDGAASKVLERGKVASCASCHQEMTKGDFVSRDYIIPAQITDGRVILHSSKAKAHGEKLHYEEEQIKNTLGYWTNSEDWAEWEFQVNRPGRFDIHLWQGCGKGCGGSEIGIVMAGQTAVFNVEETGHFQNFKERVVGQVNFAETGPQRLEVRVRKMAGPAVMDLRMIVLTPATSEAVK